MKQNTNNTIQLPSAAKTIAVTNKSKDSIQNIISSSMHSPTSENKKISN